MPKKRPVLPNPSITEIPEVSEDDVLSVWDRFQFSISQREMYSENSEDIDQLLENMNTLPIVGKKYLCQAY